MYQHRGDDVAENFEEDEISEELEFFAKKFSREPTTNKENGKF